MHCIHKRFRGHEDLGRRKRNKIEFKFINSYRFLGGALDKLASHLPSEHKIALRKEFHGGAVFPYDYLNSWDKLGCTALPAKEDFYSRLTDYAILDENYEHAQKVWNAFGIKNLGEYAMLYMKTHILLLTDIFKYFRVTMHSLFDLDTDCNYTPPGYSFDAILKFTGVKIELVREIAQLKFVERGNRGGITQGSKRYAKANNKIFG